MIVLLTANLKAGWPPGGEDSEIRALRIEFCEGVRVSVFVLDGIGRGRVDGREMEGKWEGRWEIARYEERDAYDDVSIPLPRLRMLVKLRSVKRARAGLFSISSAQLSSHSCAAGCK